MKTKEMEHKVFWSDEDEGYIATIKEYPGLSAFGVTEEDALKELEIAKVAYLEVLNASTVKTKNGLI